MPRTFKKGGQRRTILCTECGRQFTGDIKTVNRLVELHTQKEHNSSIELSNKYDKVMLSAKTNAIYDMGQNTNGAVKVIQALSSKKYDWVKGVVCSVVLLLSCIF